MIYVLFLYYVLRLMYGLWRMSYFCLIHVLCRMFVLRIVCVIWFMSYGLMFQHGLLMCFVCRMLGRFMSYVLCVYYALCVFYVLGLSYVLLMF